MIELKIKKLHPEAMIPNYAHKGDAGMDVYSLENTLIHQGERKAISTGISIEIPEEYVALVWDKSGIALKQGIKTMAGVIDSGYRGEVKIVLLNTSQDNFEIKKGQKIAQILIQRIEQVIIKETTKLTETLRAEGGFGSTGIN